MKRSLLKIWMVICLTFALLVGAYFVGRCDGRRAASLPPITGLYFLELRSPAGVINENVTISSSVNGLVISSKDIQPVSLTHSSDIVAWSWDAGYSGSEVYVGRIRAGIITGDVYAVDRGERGTWVLRPIRK
ncbi:MAG: hypothetical protein V1809_05150 [Planctomycetota bacterium]